jgi:hypothetical protein
MNNLPKIKHMLFGSRQRKNTFPENPIFEIDCNRSGFNSSAGKIRQEILTKYLRRKFSYT